MPTTTYHFPRGFLWGTATSAHQVEGNNTNNNWWAWEQEPGHILQGHRSGFACDWWGGRWREDLDRAAEGSQNTHRFSVEWSRIQPTPDRWDEEALDRYIEILRGMKERGLLPLVTLHHFSDPLWFVEKGGWENEACAGYFETFARKVVDALKDYVSYWCTINEPNVFAVSGYVLGLFPPGKKSVRAGLQVLTNQLRAHAAAYHAIHALQPAARVGIALNYRSFQPSSGKSPLDRWAAHTQFTIFNDLFPQALVSGKVSTPLGRVRVPQAKGAQDYFGLNYYTRDVVSFNLLKPGNLFAHRFYRPEARLSTTGFLAHEPEGLFEGLKWARQFKVPILITENGIEDADDSLRPTYLAEHLRQVWRAVNFNYPIKGYFHWSLVDNFEWERGWTQRFGLWELDPLTQTRRKRPSADFYAEICRENGLSSDMVSRFAPEVLSKLFPNG
jgi:beta-glucosidase